MDKKSLTYSALLLLGLVFVSFLLNRGVIQGVHGTGQVTLTTDQTVYPQGGDIVFTGELEFALNEQVDITAVRLQNTSGPTPLDTQLPLFNTSGQFFNIPVASGTLVVKVDFVGISGGTSTNTTIPGTTLPGGSEGLKGITSASKIVYTVKWTPPNTSAVVGSYSAKLSVDLKDGTKLASSLASYSIVAGSVVSISGPAVVNEASSTATYLIKVTPPSSSETVIVGYKTVDGTAVAGQDFGGASTTAIISTGEATTSVTIAITNDSLDESAENFSVVLTSTTFGTIDPAPVVTTILDDDAAVRVTLASTTATITEGNSGTTTVSIPVKLTAPAGRTVTVSYTTNDGTAKASDNDYKPKSGTLTVGPSDTPTPILIEINGDTKVESDETFTVNLIAAFASKNATETIAIVNATTTVKIVDDDAVAEVLTTKLQAALGAGNVAVVEVIIDNIKNPTTGSTSTSISGGIKSFNGAVSFASSDIQIVGVEDATGFTGTAFATTTGQATFSASASSAVGATTPVVVAKLKVILVGSGNASTTLTLDSLSIVASTTGSTVAQPSSSKATDRYLRGDADSSGKVDIGDALQIGRCSVGLLTIGLGSNQCHPLNSATPGHDNKPGDVLDIGDALQVGRFSVGLLNQFYQ